MRTCLNLSRLRENKDPDGKVVSSFPGLTKNAQEFLNFLKSGRPAV